MECHAGDYSVVFFLFFSFSISGHLVYMVCFHGFDSVRL